MVRLENRGTAGLVWELQLHIKDKHPGKVTILYLSFEWIEEPEFSPHAYSKANRARVLCEPTAPNIPFPPEDHHRLEELEDAYENEHTELIQLIQKAKPIDFINMNSYEVE